MRSRASSSKWEYPLLSPRSSSSFLRLLPRLLVISICLFVGIFITHYFLFIMRVTRNSLATENILYIVYIFAVSVSSSGCDLVTLLHRQHVYRLFVVFEEWKIFYFTTHLSGKIIYLWWQMKEIYVWRNCGKILTGEERRTVDRKLFHYQFKHCISHTDCLIVERRKFYTN
jgi:hypothetical protein